MTWSHSAILAQISLSLMKFPLSNSRNTPSVYTVGMDSESIERFEAAKIANKLTSFTGWMRQCKV